MDDPYLMLLAVFLLMAPIGLAELRRAVRQARRDRQEEIRRRTAELEEELDL